MKDTLYMQLTLILFTLVFMRAIDVRNHFNLVREVGASSPYSSHHNSKNTSTSLNDKFADIWEEDELKIDTNYSEYFIREFGSISPSRNSQSRDTLGPPLREEVEDIGTEDKLELLDSNSGYIDSKYDIDDLDRLINIYDDEDDDDASGSGGYTDNEILLASTRDRFNTTVPWINLPKVSGIAKDFQVPHLISSQLVSCSPSTDTEWADNDKLSPGLPSRLRTEVLYNGYNQSCYREIKVIWGPPDNGLSYLKGFCIWLMRSDYHEQCFTLLSSTNNSTVSTSSNLSEVNYSFVFVEKALPKSRSLIIAVDSVPLKKRNNVPHVILKFHNINLANCSLHLPRAVQERLPIEYPPVKPHDLLISEDLRQLAFSDVILLVAVASGCTVIILLLVAIYCRCRHPYSPIIQSISHIDEEYCQQRDDSAEPICSRAEMKQRLNELQFHGQNEATTSIVETPTSMQFDTSVEFVSPDASSLLSRSLLFSTDFNFDITPRTFPPDESIGRIERNCEYLSTE